MSDTTEADATEAETAGTETAGTETAGTETAGTDTAGTDTAGTDTAGTDNTEAETADTDTAGTDTGEVPVLGDRSGERAASPDNGDQSEFDEPHATTKGEALDNEGDVAADYLEELLDIADLDGDIDTFVEGGRAHVSIVTEVDQLVGKDGEVLDALQELARLAVMAETGHRSRLMLDIAGHRERRRRDLQALAKDAISEVNDSGESVRLAPMNPFERKIVHDAVAAAGLTSESEGVEPKRRVVVLPAS